MSSNSKYLAPHLRNKKLNAVEVFAPVAEEKPFEKEFPQLSKPMNTMKVWGGSESFAEKARKWNDHDKMKEIEIEEKRKEDLLLGTMAAPRMLPRFHNVRRFVEEESEEDEEVPNTENNGDSWTLVEKRHLKKKTPEEIFQEKIEKNSDSDGTNEDTLWNDEKPSNETYWNEREY